MSTPHDWTPEPSAPSAPLAGAASHPGQPLDTSATAPPVTPTGLEDGGSSSLADGEWHRMHPLTPLFKGGLALIIVAGIVLSNMRDRLIGWFIGVFVPEERDYNEYGGDPVDWVLANNMVLVAMLAVLGLVIVLVAIFWFVWRFQQFRITGDHVEVRKGFVFRSHRRAPLDRVQGVNLTRPFPARLIGLAKLEVIGAGNDANVPLEYLATARAESVRSDILRLASGARNARLAAASGVTPRAGATRREQLVGSMSAGVSGLIEGVDLADVVPESVVKIPTGRLVGSQLISAVIWVLFFGGIYAVAMIAAMTGMRSDGASDSETVVAMLGLTLGMGIPLVIAVVGITWAQISKSLRYSIAPTPDGVRITYGLLTTVTETLPPGRIFAVEVSQSLLWRPFGWWTIKINRMSGKSASQQQSSSAQQFNVVLPVGTRADVERVMALMLPRVPVGDIPALWEHGVLGPVEGDPYKTIPKRAAWRRPFSWKRQGYALTPYALLLRRGFFWRKLAVFPLARLQGISLSQGPVDRWQRVTEAQVHSVLGPISGGLSGLERADALELLDAGTRAAAKAALQDHTHRWGEWSADADTGADADFAQPMNATDSEGSLSVASWPAAPVSPLGQPGVPPAPPAPPVPPLAQPGVPASPSSVPPVPPVPPAVQPGVPPVPPAAPRDAPPAPPVPPVPPTAE